MKEEYRQTDLPRQNPDITNSNSKQKKTYNKPSFKNTKTPISKYSMPQSGISNNIIHFLSVFNVNVTDGAKGRGEGVNTPKLIIN